MITDDDGKTVCYGNDRNYRMMRDVVLPRHTVWQLPDNFSGRICGQAGSGQKLYECSTDRIFLYHPGQLSVLLQEDRNQRTVMSGDVRADLFGTGQPLTAGDDHQIPLYYGFDHNYVISAQFDTEEFKTVFVDSADYLPKSGGTTAWDGTSVYQNGVIYIANYQQLLLIGTDTEVTDTDLNASAIGNGNTIPVSGSGTSEDPYVNARYSNDGIYYLTTDISLPSRTAWTVPSGFTGYFTSEDADGQDNSVIRTSDTRLYENGKVYYHNVFPMAENAGAGIHANDYDVLNYGTGGVTGRLYLNTYNYYLASNFTARTEFDVTEYIVTTDEHGDSVTAVVIRNYEQLKLVGLGESVLKTDTINGIVRTQKVNYPSDAVYYLANDIELDDDGWQLPDGFAGRFICDPVNAQSDSQRLYTAHLSLTSRADIYIQNIYQLEMLGLDNSVRREEPVLSQDYDPYYFGTGSPIYLTNVSTDYLTYKQGYTYILSRTFVCGRVNQISTTVLGMISNGSHIDGRDFFGQTTVEIDGTAYILIGDRQQLDAIGTDRYVYGPVYAVTQTRNNILDTWTIDDNRISLIYPGDADLIDDIAVNQDGTQIVDFSTSSLFSPGGYHSLGIQRVSTTERIVYCASDGNGSYNVRSYSTNANRGTLRYTKTANYIVFRDINMNKTDKSDLNWTPLMFSGTMYGVKAHSSGEVSTLWTNGKTRMVIDTANKPVISNVSVTQNNPIIPTDYMGVGFFATIANQQSTADIGLSAGTVIVSNIKLSHVTIHNNTDQAARDTTLVSTLTSTVGGILGSTLDGVLRILLGKNSSLNELFSALLDAREQDPTIFATGAFAGRITGDVRIEDCAVSDATVYNRNSYTGGFVGYSEGITLYGDGVDGNGTSVQSTLSAVRRLLEILLNLIPGLGLGDLITILLENAVNIGELIPTDFVNPEINRCQLTGLNGTVGTSVTSFNGGFIGSQIGTIIRDCELKDSHYQVNAWTFGGGFSGIARDAEIRGLLTDLADLNISKLQPQSLLMNCSVKNSTVAVNGGGYLGGFTGALAASYAINCEIRVQEGQNHTLTVHGTGSEIGGFAGSASTGWFSDLGETDYQGEQGIVRKRTSLLGVVSSLLNTVLGSGGSSNVRALLSLAGVDPSAILGCQIDMDDVTVSGDGNCVGGIVGRGIGTYIAESSTNNINLLTYWEYGGYTISEDFVTLDSYVKGLNSVTAGGDHAGGIAGTLGTASVSGLLNDTIGIGDFLGFTVHNVRVNGIDAGYTVEAKGEYTGSTGYYAGGCFGDAIGGTADTAEDLSEHRKPEVWRRLRMSKVS